MREKRKVKGEGAEGGQVGGDRGRKGPGENKGEGQEGMVEGEQVRRSSRDGCEVCVYHASKARLCALSCANFFQTSFVS